MKFVGHKGLWVRNNWFVFGADLNLGFQPFHFVFFYWLHSFEKTRNSSDHFFLRYVTFSQGFKKKKPWQWKLPILWRWGTFTITLHSQSDPNLWPQPPLNLLSQCADSPAFDLPVGRWRASRQYVQPDAGLASLCHCVCVCVGCVSVCKHHSPISQFSPAYPCGQ